MKPRVLLILHTPPPIHGAAMVGQFIRESKIINDAFENDYINLTTSFHLDAIGKNSISKYFAVVKIHVALLKALFSRKYDLCYLSLTAKGAGFYKDLLVVAVLKLFKKKILFHFHNKGVALNSQNIVNRCLYKFTFYDTQSILLSPHLYQDIAQYIKAKDVFICPNGIPSKLEKVAEHEEITSDTRKVCRILFLSNMMVEKGLFTLLEACKLLKKQELSFECHFVGDWADITEKAFWQEVEKHDIAKYVFAHGRKYDEEKLAFFQRSNVFVLPTFNECFPLVLLEAMDHSLPVVVTPEGGIPDIVLDGETGFLVPKKSAETLAEKLKVLIQNPALRLQMGAAGKKRYNAFFTIEKFEQNFKAILEKAIYN